ncbi:MAG: zinc-dependent metalloprotease, partial [Polyangiaceae bacterium]
MRNQGVLRLRARAARRLAPGGLVATVALLALSTSIGSCAGERDPINRVQADALQKSFFVGAKLQDSEDDPEFYKRGTVVDVGYGAAQSGLFTSTYAQPVSRIRWEIAEKTLNARLAYERIKGTDGKGNPRNGVERKQNNDGQIVASYAIESHFDIRRDYNPQTGEELNLVVENDSDRPWYAREYFRVDWSKNLVTDSYDFDTLAQLGVFGGVKYDAFAYTVLDPEHADAPHFDKEAGYFDVTNKAYATPQIVDLSGLDAGAEQFPACMLSSYFGGTEPYGNCGPIELTIRESYRRVGGSDYEPVDHDGLRFQVLGGFNFDYRRSYARNYGILDKDWMRFLARYDIWERSHYYTDPKNMTGAIACATKETTEVATGDPNADPNRDDDGDGTADECAAVGNGAHCDVYTQKCALSYQQRKPKTIPWYIAGDMSLFEATNWAVLEWDLALKTAIQTARLTECRRLGGGEICDTPFAMWTGQQEDIDEAVRIARSVDACRRANGFNSPSCVDRARSLARAVAEERGNPEEKSANAIGAIASMEPVLVLCHNPVIASDHAACGKAGTVARSGDLRYNVVLNVESPQTPSPWGIMVDGNDPLTGEKIAGSMNVWTHVTDMAAQQLVDLVRYVNGDLTTEQITNGSYVRDWATGARLSSGSALPLLSRSEVVSRLAGGTKLDRAAFDALTRGTTLPEVKQLEHTGKGRALDVQARSDVASPSVARLRATLDRGRGSAVEAQLVNPAIQQLAGKSGNGADLGNISPLTINQPRLYSRLKQARENALAARGACILSEAPEPTSLSGLADILRLKFPKDDGETPILKQMRQEQMFQYVRQHYHYAVMAHEMGHSIGLRHNFVSSSAPLFYRPQYWQLRTKNGAVTTPCTDAVTDGASCVGPRYWDPVTEEEQSQLITMWMQSSAMDYAGDPAQDMIGLGVTDFASTRFFYGDTVSVYTSPDYRARTAVGTGITSVTDSFGGLLGIRYGVRAAAGTTGVDEFNYSQLQNRYKVITGCTEVKAEPPADWNEGALGKWHPVLDGHIVSVDGKAVKCRQQPVDYVPYTSLRMPTAAEASNTPYRGSPSVENGTNRLRVPYAFGSDTWADIGNVSVFRHDNGADPYEQAQFLISTQENRHIFDNYRRDRTTFTVRGAVDRSFDRYNAKLQALTGGMGFLASIYDELSTNQGYAFDSVWPIIVKDVVHDNMIAATVAFDHFTRQLARPEPGEHGPRPVDFADPVLRSLVDPDDFGGGGGPVVLGRNLVVPNGSTGYLRDVGFGGHPLENRLPDGAGEFRTDYVQNAGSYYEKINIATLLAESEDRFISESRRDFYDSRFRAVGVADVLGEGFRRIIANALTGDRSLLAPRVIADATGNPVLDTRADTTRDPLANRYPASPLGWPSFWPKSGPETCFASGGRNTCTNYAGDGGFDPATHLNTVPVDPQIGWEVQKFLIVWTVAHIKANEKTTYTDMMRLYPIGQSTKPEFDQRIEWQDPISGQLYYAKTFGKE